VRADNSGPAFPCQPLGIGGSPLCELQPGISVRDYFAAKALNGICAHDDSWGLSIQGIASTAYDLADAMLAERAK
jgi:hypothetical protein